MKLQDFATKMREMEISLIDTRAEIDRRLSAGQESLASKLDLAIQSMTATQISGLGQAS